MNHKSASVDFDDVPLDWLFGIRQKPSLRNLTPREIDNLPLSELRRVQFSKPPSGAPPPKVSPLPRRAENAEPQLAANPKRRTALRSHPPPQRHFGEQDWGQRERRSEERHQEVIRLIAEQNAALREIPDALSSRGMDDPPHPPTPRGVKTEPRRRSRSPRNAPGVSYESSGSGSGSDEYDHESSSSA